MEPSRAALLRIATANQQLIETVKGLYYALNKSSDPEIAQTVGADCEAVLGLTERISAAVAPPDSDLLMIASSNHQIIAQTQELYYRLAKSTDSQVLSLGMSYISRVLDLTGQISAAIPDREIMSDHQRVGQPDPPPAAPAPVSPTDLTARFHTAQSASQQSIERAGTRADKDRTKIAVTIMGVSAVSIFAALILLTFRGFANPTKDAWVDVTKDAADLIKTSAVSIVTLMLGYYFGTSGRS